MDNKNGLGLPKPFYFKMFDYSVAASLKMPKQPQ